MPKNQCNGPWFHAEARPIAWKLGAYFSPAAVRGFRGRVAFSAGETVRSHEPGFSTGRNFRVMPRSTLRLAVPAPVSAVYVTSTSERLEMRSPSTRPVAAARSARPANAITRDCGVPSAGHTDSVMAADRPARLGPAAPMRLQVRPERTALGSAGTFERSGDDQMRPSRTLREPR